MTAGAISSGRPWMALALIAPAVVFLAMAFLVPLGQLALLSFSSRSGALAPYADLLTSDVYRRVFVNTATVAVVTTCVCLVVGFPVAFALTRLTAGWRALLLAAVLFPLWISVLVRTFSWMLLLERNGPVNRFLVGWGLVDEPLQFLFNQTGVLIGMVHVLLPYAVLPIYAALVRIDPALYLASDGLGAGRLTTFRRVILPLSMHGIATGATFVFLLSLGFFITPALMGGARSITLPMLIETLVNERLQWPLAAAASVILLAMTLLILAATARIANMSGLAAHR